MLDVVELLKRMVRFPSLSHEEAPLADFLEDYVREAGARVGRHGDNIYFTLGDGDDRLLLNSHLDVVPPSEGHPYDPFDAVEIDGKLYGRGTVDAKASGAGMITAFLELLQDGWKPPEGQLIVALTTCEEMGGEYNGLEDLRPHLPPLRAAIVGEPTELQPCVAQKGLLILNVVANGRSAHAARSHLGDNAIFRAARDLDRLSGVVFNREDPFLGAPTLTATTIAGGTARNVVPDRCQFTLDIRTTPAYTHPEITAMIADLLESEVHVHSDRFVPVKTEVDSRIVRACRKALPGAEPFGSPTASDWIFLKDVPTVKLGPGPSTRSHTAEEHIELDELRRGVNAYRAIIEQYYASE